MICLENFPLLLRNFHERKIQLQLAQNSKKSQKGNKKCMRKDEHFTMKK
jgi:hypothetical protein